MSHTCTSTVYDSDNVFMVPMSPHPQARHPWLLWHSQWPQKQWNLTNALQACHSSFTEETNINMRWWCPHDLHNMPSIFHLYTGTPMHHSQRKPSIPAVYNYMNIFAFCTTCKACVEETHKGRCSSILMADLTVLIMCTAHSTDLPAPHPVTQLYEACASPFRVVPTLNTVAI